MPRPQSPEGAWVTIPVRLREAQVKQIDAIVGEGGNRSEWMRQAALTALGLREPGVTLRAAPEPGPPPVGAVANGQSAAVPTPAPRKRKPPKVTTAAELVKPPEERQEASIPAPPKRYRCPHPGKRQIGGWCAECDALVSTGGGLPDGYVPPWAKDGKR